MHWLMDCEVRGGGRGEGGDRGGRYVCNVLGAGIKSSHTPNATRDQARKISISLNTLKSR